MSRVAKPMICPNFRIGSSNLTAATAILCPFGIRSRAVAAPSGATPAGISSTAIITLSDAFRHNERGGAMACFPVVCLRLGGEQSWPLTSDRLEQVARDIEVPLHRIASSVGVDGFDRRDNGVMLGQHFANPAGRRHEYPPDALKVNAKTVQHFARASHGQPGRQNLMKSDVRGIKGRAI